jgi:CheY-like chemotaxis protein
MEYRILIVSEDAAQRNRYAETLLAMPPMEEVSYQIATVGSVAAAQLQATRQRFDLVIVALSQQDDGLQLSSRLKELFPAMRLLLLCEQGVTKSQLKTARLIRASVAESTIEPNSLRAIVSDMLGTSSLQSKKNQNKPDQRQHTTGIAGTATIPTKLTQDVLQPFFDPFLDELRRQTNAQVAIISDKQGRILGQNGEDKAVDMAAVVTVIAQSCSDVFRLGHMLHDPKTIHLSVHEGKHYDVYSANVGEERFLALFFNKEFTTPKFGLIWLVLKRNVEKFSRMS